MTKQELNRDVKRLSKLIGTDKEYTPEFEKEYKRLYYADSTFDYFNLESVRIMLRMNARHRFIPFHQFGLMININE